MEYANLTISSDLLDFDHPDLVKLVADKGWGKLPAYEGIGAVYDFVRNQIRFGYNRDDALMASEILRDGYGQCNTKGTLLMALLRAISVPCRLHGFTVHKNVQRGIIPELVFQLTPDNLFHSWVEVFFDGAWINLEGFILDDSFLGELQRAFGGGNGEFCGYGAGMKNIQNPVVNWVGKDTYVQSAAINQDFGLFETPDEFYADHRQDLPWWKRILYQRVIRHWMNLRVQKIRDGHVPKPLSTSTYNVARRFGGE